jgi:hypothetical protein
MALLGNLMASSVHTAIRQIREAQHVDGPASMLLLAIGTANPVMNIYKFILKSNIYIFASQTMY